MSNQFLFVYGILRRDTNSEMYHLLARHADFVGEGTFQGKLYRIDYYPGVVPTMDKRDRVFGEVYRLLEPDLVLPLLDQYEECGPGFSDPTEYVRRIEKILLRSGRIMSAWVYVYNRPTDNFDIIESGDFLHSRTIKENSRARLSTDTEDDAAESLP